MSEKVAHLAVAVKSLAEVAVSVEKVFGKKLSEVEEVPSQKVRLQFVEIGGLRFEFLEPTSSESPISKFLEKRGSGIHHIAFETSGLEARLKNLQAQGVSLINEKPVAGAEDCQVAFLHPKSLSGVLVEFIEAKSH